ncbi:MAG TPA: CRISPR-associated endonuclease Cas1 [Methanocorpusculum sp.]|nr:CRISPR-associated endonuclease Cas1 [Methanocorpusculum sp.]
MSEVSWVTVFGFGADIRTTKDTLIISQKGTSRYYPLDEVSHLVICGGHTLQTSALAVLRARNIAVTFFDAKNRLTGTISDNAEPVLRARQKVLPVQKFALSVISASMDARMLFLHELDDRSRSGIFYKGELEILTKSQSELAYLVTMQEFNRVFSLNRTMYYEILSRVVPRELGFRRLTDGVLKDPVNVLFSLGYAVLYANASLACTGAGLDLHSGALFSKAGSCVYDIIEAAKPSMVDRVVIDMASSDALSGGFESGSRCILSEEIVSEFYNRLQKSVNRAVLEENVQRYADAVKGICAPVLHY